MNYPMRKSRSQSKRPKEGERSKVFDRRILQKLERHKWGIGCRNFCRCPPSESMIIDLDGRFNVRVCEL